MYNLSVSVCQSINLCLYLSLSTYLLSITFTILLQLNLRVYFYIHLSICLIYPSLYIFKYPYFDPTSYVYVFLLVLSFCIFIFGLAIFLCIYPISYMSIYLSICIYPCHRVDCIPVGFWLMNPPPPSLPIVFPFSQSISTPPSPLLPV